MAEQTSEEEYKCSECGKKISKKESEEHREMCEICWEIENDTEADYGED
jgi:DNA-directed RNA polymerase subunit RPC12/RpoP